MVRLTSAIIIGAAVVALVTPAHAQQPRGSISGQIVVESGTLGGSRVQVLIMPANVPQPWDHGDIADHIVSTDETLRFSRGSLAAGDYFVLIAEADIEVLTPLPETVRLEFGEEKFTLPALRVSLAAGQHLTGLKFVIRGFEVQPVSDGPGGLSPSAVIAPGVGSGPHADASSGAIIGAAIAGLAGIVLAGGAALRLRERRLRR